MWPTIPNSLVYLLTLNSLYVPLYKLMNQQVPEGHPAWRIRHCLAEDRIYWGGLVRVISQGIWTWLLGLGVGELWDGLILRMFRLVGQRCYKKELETGKLVTLIFTSLTVLSDCQGYWMDSLLGYHYVSVWGLVPIHIVLFTPLMMIYWGHSHPPYLDKTYHPYNEP